MSSWERNPHQHREAPELECWTCLESMSPPGLAGSNPVLSAQIDFHILQTWLDQGWSKGRKCKSSPR